MLKTNRQQLAQPELLGTNSILSQVKKHNAECLVQDIWEFDHDPNDSFLISVFNGKLRKYHSLENCDEGAVSSQGLMQNVQKQHHHSLLSNYHNMRHSAPAIEQDYGIKQMDPDINKDVYSKKQVTLTVQNQSELAMVNQMQRVLSFQSCQTTMPAVKLELAQAHQDQNYTHAGSFIVQHPQKGRVQDAYESNSREEVILGHKRISNANYLMRQTKELLYLTRAHWLRLQIEQSRKMLVKLEIQCRRLKICLRNSNSAGSRLRSDKKVQLYRNEDTSTAVFQEYGYPSSKIRPIALHKYRHASEKSIYLSQHRSRLKIIGNKNIDSEQGKYVQKKGQHNSPNRLNRQPQKLESKTSSNTLSMTIKHRENETKQSYSSQEQTKINQLQNKMLKNVQARSSEGSKAIKEQNRALDEGYIRLLLEKRRIITQTIQQFQQHYDYKAAKLLQENCILKGQLKMVAQLISDSSAQTVRSKHNINSKRYISTTIKPEKTLNNRNEIVTPINSPSHQIAPQFIVCTLKRRDRGLVAENWRGKGQIQMPAAHKSRDKISCNLLQHRVQSLQKTVDKAAVLVDLPCADQYLLGSPPDTS